MLFNFFGVHGGDSGLSNITDWGKGVVGDFRGTFDTANNLGLGNGVGKDSTGRGGVDSGSIRVRNASGMDGAGKAVSSGDGELGTSGHENNGKDNLKQFQILEQTKTIFNKDYNLWC